MTTQELQHELSRIKQIKHSATETNRPNKHYDDLNENQKKAQNLYGVNSSQFDPNQETTKTTNVNNSIPAPREDDTNPEEESAVKVTRTELYIRPKVTFKGDKVNASNTIKNYVLQLRKADPMIQILPLDASNDSQNDILEGETVLPDEQEKMATWVNKIATKGRRLEFDMRISTIDIKALKSHIFAWAHSNGSYTSISKNTTVSDMFQAGWLYGLSARYYNRDDILAYILTQKPAFKGHLTVYSKEVYYYRDDNSKAKTYAIAIDGSWTLQKDILDFLYNHEWKENYSSGIFVPYKTNKVFQKADQVHMVESHNEYDNSIMKYVLQVVNARTYHQVGEKKLSFQNWLLHTTINKCVILGVEVAPDNKVRVIFYKRDKDEIIPFLKNIYHEVEQVFGEAIANELLDKSECMGTHALHARELEYARKLQAKKILPTSGIPASQLEHHSKPKCIFGSYAEAANHSMTPSVISQDDSSTSSDKSLKAQLEALQQKQAEYEKDFDERVNTAVTQAISTNASQQHTAPPIDSSELKELREQVTRIEASQTSLKNEINVINKKFETRDEEYTERFNNMMKAITTASNNMSSNISLAVQEGIKAYVTNNPPSGQMNLSRGGDK